MHRLGLELRVYIYIYRAFRLAIYIAEGYPIYMLGLELRVYIYMHLDRQYIAEGILAEARARATYIYIYAFRPPVKRKASWLMLGLELRIYIYIYIYIYAFRPPVKGGRHPG